MKNQAGEEQFNGSEESRDPRHATQTAGGQAFQKDP
jgi:hypothetical protein